MAQKGILDRIGVATHLVVARGRMSAGEVSGVLHEGAWEPEGEGTCELKAGGQIVARGSVIKRHGRWYFKALEVAKGGTA